MRPELLDRQELYDHVWTQPVSHLAAAWNTKSWHIKKWCKDLDVPLPEVGHWARLQHGWQVERTPLPPREPEQPDRVKPEKVQAAPEPITFKGESQLNFKVADRLVRPDPLIMAAEKSLAIKRGDQTFVCAESHELAIRVTPKNVGRALRIMDTLVKCWKHRGYRIECREYQTFVHLRDVTQRILLREVQKTKAVKTNSSYARELEPTGILAIRMDWWGGREWRDGTRPLEEQVLEILNHMELSARQIERERETRPLIGKDVVEILPDEEEELPEEEHSPESAATGRQLSGWPSDLRHLLADAQRWKELRVLDEYLAALFAARPHTPAFLQWLNWAQAERKRADPLEPY